MAGNKNSGAWNKRDEWDWRDLVKENSRLLMKLAKRYNLKKFANKKGEFDEEAIIEILADKDQKQLFFKAIDAATAVCMRAMPNKVEGTGDNGEFIIKVEVNEDKPAQKPGNRISQYIEI